MHRQAHPAPATAHVHIRRFDAGRPDLPSETDHAVEITDTKTVLAALLEIQAKQDTSLSFRASCRHGACGSCTMEINGRPRLACTRLLRSEVDRHGRVHIAPLPGVPVLRDLIVDRFGRYPHRNAVLGRTSTPEELEFLTQPGSSF